MANEHKLAVIGLGYVGILAAVTFAKKFKVIAFDIDKTRIETLKNGEDTNHEVSSEELKNSNIYYTHELDNLKEANFYVISVPTPLDHHKNPDLSIVLNASKMLAPILKKGDVIVYESSVYPGATEEKCIPLLEEISHMHCGKDFYVGFSPERINPSDKIHTIETIPKIISGINEHAQNVIAAVYEKVIQAGVFRVSNIRTAEAIKIIENTQRDINIAYMNEIAMILHKLDIDTSEVIAGMKTKWNFIPFQPGLVGGHCIGVNSHYLMYKAEDIGYHLPLIEASRLTNENILKFIASEAINHLILSDISIRKARIAVLGLTYKENCSDIRDTKVFDIIHMLQAYGPEILIHDPLADPEAVKKEFHMELQSWENLKNLDAIILAVAHKQYLNLDKQELKQKLNNQGLIMDIKEILDPKDFADTHIKIWKL